MAPHEQTQAISTADLIAALDELDRLALEAWVSYRLFLGDGVVNVAACYLDRSRAYRDAASRVARLLRARV